MLNGENGIKLQTWVNGTIPVIATPGNHEYLNDSQRKRVWKNKNGKDIKIEIEEYTQQAPGVYKLTIEDCQKLINEIKN